MLSHHYSADSLFEATIWARPKKRDFLFRTVQKRSSSFSIMTEHNVISADIRSHVDLIIELCWLIPNTAHNNYYPQCSMSFYRILTNESLYISYE